MATYKFKDAVKTGKEKGGFEEGTKIAVLAYHAKTEAGTAEIAEAVHEKSPSSMYVFKGNRVASTKVTHTHSDKLKSLVKEAETAVSVHGYKNKKGVDNNVIYVSGQHGKLSSKIAKELQKNFGDNYHIETNPDYIPKHLQGKSDYNIVNKFEKGGVQIELPEKLRKQEKDRQIVGDSISNVVNQYNEGKVLKYEKKDEKKDYKKAV